MSLTLLNVLAAVIIAITFVATNAAYLVWAERKGAGFIQRRPAQPKMARGACCSHRSTASSS